MAPGGGAVGTGYASLTGPGQTVTPGDLTQEGGLTVQCTFGSAGFQVYGDDGGTLGVDPGGSPGVGIGSPALISLINSGHGAIALGAGLGGMTLTAAGAGIIICGATEQLSFFNVPVVSQQPAPSTLADVITGLQNLGLFA